MKLRRVLTKILNRTDLEVSDLLTNADELADYELLLELERLWSHMTSVKVSANVMIDELGLKPGSKRVIVCLTKNESTVEALSRKYPGCIIAHAGTKEKFYDLMSYFNLWSCINFLVLERVNGLSLLRFSHFVARIAAYFSGREDVGYYILAPKADHENFNPYFIKPENIITEVDKIPL